jgi:hypothetical protein
MIVPSSVLGRGGDAVHHSLHDARRYVCAAAGICPRKDVKSRETLRNNRKWISCPSGEFGRFTTLPGRRGILVERPTNGPDRPSSRSLPTACYWASVRHEVSRTVSRMQGEDRQPVGLYGY